MAVQSDYIKSVDGSFIIDSQMALQVPRGPTSSDASLTVNGMMRYDTDLNQMKFRINGGWVQLSSAVVAGPYVLKVGDTMTGNLTASSFTPK